MFTKNKFNGFKQPIGETEYLRELKEKSREEDNIKYYPKGIENYPEPPLDTSEKLWKFRTKNGEIVEFKPSKCDELQDSYVLNWITIDLESLGNKEPWKLKRQITIDINC